MLVTKANVKTALRIVPCSSVSHVGTGNLKCHKTTQWRDLEFTPQTTLWGIFGDGEEFSLSCLSCSLGLPLFSLGTMSADPPRRRRSSFSERFQRVFSSDRADQDKVDFLPSSCEDFC